MAMKFSNDAPWESTVAITPSDATIYNPVLRGAILLVTGTVRIVTNDGVTEDWNVPAVPYFIPRYIKQILATGTDAFFNSANLKSGR